MVSARPVFKVRDRDRDWAGTVSTSETETLIHEYSRPKPGKCVFSRPRPRPGKWSRPSLADLCFHCRLITFLKKTFPAIKFCLKSIPPSFFSPLGYVRFSLSFSGSFLSIFGIKIRFKKKYLYISKQTFHFRFVIFSCDSSSIGSNVGPLVRP